MNNGPLIKLSYERNKKMILKSPMFTEMKEAELTSAATETLKQIELLYRSCESFPSHIKQTIMELKGITGKFLSEDKTGKVGKETRTVGAHKSLENAKSAASVSRPLIKHQPQKRGIKERP